MTDGLVTIAPEAGESGALIAGATPNGAYGSHGRGAMNPQGPTECMWRR